MGFQIETEDWKQDDVDGSGGNFLDDTTIGWGHFVIESVEEPDDDDTNPYCDIEIKGLAPAAFRDKTRNIRFWLTGAGSRRFAKLTVALGYKTKEEWNEARAEGRGVDIDFEALVNRQMCAELVPDEYEKTDDEGNTNVRKSCKVEWNMVTVEEGKAKGYPVDGVEAESAGASEFPTEEIDTGL